MGNFLVSTPVRALLRVAVPVSILALCASLLAQHISVDLVQSLPDRLADIAPWRWCLALLFTAASFWAVAQYDALAHKTLRTGIAPERARLTGAVAIALGQTLGFGVATGALARWRMLADLDLARAAKVSAYISVSFVAAWAVLTALAVVLLPAPDWAFWPAALMVALLPVAALGLFWWPKVHIGGLTFRATSFRTSGAVLGWALVDTAMAGAALYVLLPADTIGFAPFFPLFLIALGSGLISNTPGGVGPFELVLLGAVPFSDPAPVVVAILGYRIVYYALPALIAGAALLRPFGPAPRPYTAPLRPAAPTTRSEVGVVAQNGGTLLRNGDSTVAAWPTGQMLTQFTDPVAGTCVQALHHIDRAAAQAGAFPMIYKCFGPMAATARSAGWRVLHIADEAVVPLDTYDTALPARRTLRRKLRAADKAGVRITAKGQRPTAAMARIDTEWQGAHGRARGGSMGRYCPSYVADQWVGCAYVGDRLVAFATAHRARDEWCLDIIRHGGELPDGTMHALIHAAITEARQSGARSFSLAATPACPDPSVTFWRWAAAQVVQRAGGRGLRQFKSSFAPRWRPLYAAAPSWPSLTLGLADVARAIHAPIPLAPVSAYTPHNKHENYAVDSCKAA